MTSRAFLDVLKKTQKQKDLSEVLVGTGTKWLNEGTHNVHILGVDTSDLENDRLSVTYTDADGTSYTDKLFILDFDKQGFSIGFRFLLTGLFNDPEMFGVFLEAVEEDNEMFQAITGMKLKLTLSYSKGWFVKALDSNMYAAFDRETDAQVTEAFPSIEEARDAANDKGLKKSYLRVRRLEPSHAESNAASLYVAIEARKRAKKAASNPNGANAGAGAGASSIV